MTMYTLPILSKKIRAYLVAIFENSFLFLRTKKIVKTSLVKEMMLS